MTPPTTTPEKKEVVRQLNEASRLLEVLGAEGFRVNAYAGAARQLDAFEGDFALLFDERRLNKLRGIGKALAAELYALAGRERLELLDELYAQVPDGVRELFRVSGLGPKKVRLLWLSGIDTLTELVAAASDGRVAELKGFGAKSAQTIGEAAGFALEATARLRLDEAEVVAGAFAVALAQTLPEAELHWAGELRRALETVGTFRAVVVGVTAATLAETLATFGTVLEQAKTEVTATFANRRFELLCVQDGVLGAALAVRTGDDAFASALRARAAAKGLQLTVTGLSEAGTLLPTPVEEDVFTRLELPYVPPERRDVLPGLDPEKLIADAATAQPLITLKDLRGLVHNHTNWSDAAASIREMVARARSLGYGYLALADHSRTSSYANGLSIERVFAQAEEIKAVRRELQDEGAEFGLLHGLEVDILPDGTLDYPDEVLETLDYAVVSVHQHFTLSKTKQTERLVRAVQNPYASILAHPTGRLLLRRPGYELDVGAVLEACAATGTVVELNANPHRLDLDWRQLSHARDLGCSFSIDPDAHHPDGYDDLRYGVLMARKAGLKAADVVTTAPTADAFLARLKSRVGTL